MEKLKPPPLVIYPDLPSPAGSIVLPSDASSQMTRTSSPQSPVYANFQLLSCTARSVTAASGGLLHHLLTLTTSCTKHGARGCFLLHSTDLTAPFPLGSKMLCVARTFLLPTLRQQATSCPSDFFLSNGKKNNFVSLDVTLSNKLWVNLARLFDYFESTHQSQCPHCSFFVSPNLRPALKIPHRGWEDWPDWFFESFCFYSASFAYPSQSHSSLCSFKG